MHLKQLRIRQPGKLQCNLDLLQLKWQEQQTQMLNSVNVMNGSYTPSTIYCMHTIAMAGTHCGSWVMS